MKLLGTGAVCVFTILTAAGQVGVDQPRYYVQASRTAIVRAEPDGNARMLLRLQRGDRLNAVTGEQTDSFYHVVLPNGDNGWVSRYVVRLHRGVAAESVPSPTGADVATGTGLTARQREYAAFHLAVGVPRGYTVLVREGYVAAYDPSLKIPVWVQYRLTRERSENDTHPRSNAFDEDAELRPQARATLGDYAAVSTDYVRGHMAPAADMRWSESAERASNLLTNIAPQIGATYNGSIWRTIEDRIRVWILARGDLTVICGPVFSSRPSTVQINRQPVTLRQKVFNVIGENDVAVPSAFFKIIVDARDPEHPDVLAFLVPHIATELGPERSVETHLTSVDRIEELTGLDFLGSLSEQVQREVEAVVPGAPW